MSKKSAFLISFLFFGVLTLFAANFIVVRSKVINVVKKEILKVQDNLNEAGYDIAYEDLRFSNLPFFVLKISDLKIYSLDADNYVEWQIPEFKVNTSVLSASDLSVSMSSTQYFKKGETPYIADFPDLKINLNLNDKSINISSKNLSIAGVLEAAGLKFSAKRVPSKNEIAPFFESTFEARKIKISDEVELSGSKEIERLFVNANIEGVITEDGSYKNTMLNWLNKGGVVDIRKLILNWEPLTLVGRGDLFFNQSFEPNLHLTASARGLLEALKPLDESGKLDSKGIFVVKIILNNKAFKINDTDIYNTVTTPIDLNLHEFSVENIPLIKF